MIRASALAAALALTLAACDKAPPVDPQADNAAVLPDPVQANVSDPSGAPPPPNAPTPPRPGSGPDSPAAAIPTALQGRWGLTPADCTSTRGDAKGLLTVGPGELRFYESRAVPTANVQSSADSFSADFAFTGEGMTWSKYQTLKRQGDKLVRTESNPMASFTYARCD